MADAICAMLCEGESLRKMCEQADMPAQRTVYAWLEKHPAFQQQYARAREIQGHVLAEMAVDAARDARDPQLARLKFDALRWHAGKLVPKVYGEKSTVDLTVSEAAPLVQIYLPDNGRAGPTIEGVMVQEAAE
jgi:hypothetical protein